MFRQIGKSRDLQTPAAVAVVIPTTLRPSLDRAVRSVFAQDFAGSIQLLIGVDVAQGARAMLDRLADACPDHVAITLCEPGYSTSIRHGGLYPNRFSGGLRTILTYLANSQYVAYLDDDNWWGPAHLSTLRAAIEGVSWAWSDRWLVEAATAEPICIDDWESVGPDAGVFAEQFGGFVDPSSLMIDKLACHDIVPFWCLSPFEDGTGEDRLIFAGLKGALAGRPSGQATSFYTINPADPMHTVRLQMMRERDVVLPSARRAGVRRLAEVVAEFRHPAAGASGPPAGAADRVLRELLMRLKPREIVDLASGQGHAAVTLAQAALDWSAEVTVVATDAWTAAEHAALVARLPGCVVALPPDRGMAWLAGQTLAVDLVHLNRRTDDGALRAAWPMLRPGGVLLGDGATTAEVEGFAARMGATLLPAELDGAVYWIVEKPATT